MKKNQLIITAPGQQITLLKSEIIDLFEQLENLNVENTQDLTIEMEDMIDDVVQNFSDQDIAAGLKRRIQIMRTLINFFKTVEVTK